MTPEQQKEWLLCSESPAYFINTYVRTYDATRRDWVPFALWPAQYRVVKALTAHNLTILLKARQLGMTAIVLAYALWMMLFQPGSTILLFSRRDTDAIELLDFRLKGMFSLLPDWLRATAQVVASNDHEWVLSCGSRALAFPTTGGDSYTASLAVVDEADLVPSLDKVMAAVKPTVDAGGKMVLLSRVDKSTPTSTFKTMYRSAKAGENEWHPVFLPWSARPERTQEWYDAQVRDSIANHGSLDYVYEQYPATDAEALAPRSLDKRIPAVWLLPCYVEQRPLPLPATAPALPGLELYVPPRPDRTYVIGADPAEGNPTSDDSALTVVDEMTGEECAVLSGKVEPAVFADYCDQIGTYYNSAPVLVERNNHGHAVIGWLNDNSMLMVLEGLDERDGWLDNSKGKSLLYSTTADNFRTRDATIHSEATYAQLASIEGASLRAPKGEPDDRADSYALAQVARTLTGETFAAATGGSRPIVDNYRGIR